MKPIIKVENLSKQYILGGRKNRILLFVNQSSMPPAFRSMRSETRGKTEKIVSGR